MKLTNNKGLTLVELTVSVALMSVLALAVFNVLRYFERQEKIQLEDVQNIILKFGGARVLQNDITKAAPGFNFIHLKDVNDRSFFVLPTNDYCNHDNCARKYVLEIPENEVRSKPIFFLVTDSQSDEHTRFEIEPSRVFHSPTPGVTNYIKLNPQPTNNATSISKTIIPFSPWVKQRLILLSSSNLFYDCNNLSMQLNGTNSCPKRCVENSACNYSATRQLKFLGKVKENETELDPVTVISWNDLLKSTYHLCRSNNDGPCQWFEGPTTINSSQTFYDNLPYQVGSDNLTTLTPVKLVRYHLQRPSATSTEDKIVLMRSTATITASNQLSFESAHILMSGVKTIEFTRPNISNPTIEFKIIRASLQRAVQ